MKPIVRSMLITLATTSLVTGIVYAATINGVATQTIAPGDIMSDRWFQQVNDHVQSNGGVIGWGSATVTLPARPTPYTVNISATYFTCEDLPTDLLIDWAVVKSYTGHSGDSEGCDQNTIQLSTQLAAGASHSLSFSRWLQHDFMWFAF